MTEKWRAEKYISFLLHDDEHFLMKASLYISALHFSVIVFEWFCRQSFCLLEKLAALDKMSLLLLRLLFGQSRVQIALPR